MLSQVANFGLQSTVKVTLDWTWLRFPARPPFFLVFSGFCSQPLGTVNSLFSHGFYTLFRALLVIGAEYRRSVEQHRVLTGYECEGLVRVTVSYIVASRLSGLTFLFVWYVVS